MYKKTLLITCCVFYAINIFAQRFSVTDAGSSIEFKIKNFGITVNGSFKGLKGNITFNTQNTATAIFNLSVNANTVNTGIDSRDNHLKKEDYFDVTKFPVLSFRSVRVTSAGKEGQFSVNGNITIKGVTRNISFPFTAVSKQTGYLFTGSFTLNRRDFGVGSSSIILSDNLDVSFSINATK
jgi:polyisoprenoid-binding protein YceI